MVGKKVLIIKIGYSEFLDKEGNSRVVSLGDVLRTTVILNIFKDDKVTWVSDESAFPLLENNPFIERLLHYDLTTVFQLKSEEFDTVINLEKIPGICALSDGIRARKSRFGFTFNTQTGNAEAYDKAFDVLAVSANPNLKKKNSKTFQELLFEMVGSKWNSEEYILGYNPSSTEKYDVGLNIFAGSKWPSKMWSIKKWDALEEMLVNSGFNVSRQDKQDKEILTNLYRYMDWLNSCKVVVSNDSLGMHLGIALRKKILGLFGPTTQKEVYLYGRGKAILPEFLPPCAPCTLGACLRGQSCIDSIQEKKVYSEIINLLESKQENGTK